MNTASTWLDSDPCPACGSGLFVTDDGTAAVTQDCPACGWTTTFDLAGQSGVAPVLLIVLTEAGQAYQLAFTQLATTAATAGPLAAARTTTADRAGPTPAPAPRPAASERKHAASPSRTEFAAALAEQIRCAPAWRPDYAALMADTGMSRSWCEKRVAEARDLAAIPRLNGNDGQPSPAALAGLPEFD